MKAYVQDMTKGNEMRHLIHFMIPVLIGNVFQQIYNIVNSIIVGRYEGDEALAAVGNVGSLNFLFFSICMGLSLGVGIVIAHFFGAKKESLIKKTIANTVYILGVAGIVMGSLGVILAKPILIFMKTPEEVMPHALIYMQIMAAGMVFVAAYNGISAILRSLGDTKTPLIFLCISSIINAVLVFFFVRDLHMGIAGAAIATVSSQAIAALGSIIFAVKRNPYLKLEKAHFRWDSEIVKKCVQVGIPLGLQNAFIALSLLALQSVVNGFGLVAMAAFTAAGRIEQLIHLPFNSMGAAVSTFTSQNMGNNDIDRVKRGFLKSVKMVVIFSLTTYVFIFVLGHNLLGGFTNNPESIELGMRAMRITGLFYMPLGFIYVTRGVLNGAGDATYALINGLIEVVGRIGFSLLLVQIPSVGVWGIWLTTGMTWLITGIAGMIRYRQGKWKKIKL